MCWRRRAQERVGPRKPGRGEWGGNGGSPRREGAPGAPRDKGRCPIKAAAARCPGEGAHGRRGRRLRRRRGLFARRVSLC
ncbi:uncharacterized protein [Gorilla gorilla gorilla]|uniref:uncharacterized protein isoform X2 n=1 Tax=Gorilla gorilla gorilla TaxID=9595 RepID=UPI003008569F